MTRESPRRRARAQRSAGPRQKLRPNAFARLARFCGLGGWLVVVIYAALATLAGTYAFTRLAIDPDQRPLVILDAETARLQAQLERAFPGIEQSFLAVVQSSDPETARQQALALAAALQKRKDLFVSAFVPGTGSFYEVNAPLFHDIAFLRARVDNLIQLEPLHYALASAPDMLGFATLVKEIGKAVSQGRSPPGLEAMLLAAAGAIEGEVKGKPRPVQWVSLAGLGQEISSQEWYVLATPQQGAARQAAAAARAASNGMQEVSWLWPRRALAASPSTMRDFVVPAGLSLVFTLMLSVAVLGSLGQGLALMCAGAVTLSAAAAAAAAMGRPLDSVTWSFALAVLAPVFVAGGAMCAAFGGSRAKGLAAVQSAMLAAHRQGPLATAAILLFAAMWLAWLPRQLPSLSQFAVIALIGCAVAWLVALTLVPAALVAFSGRRTEDDVNWLDDALDRETSPTVRTVLDALAMIVLAAAIFCAAFLPALRFGEQQLPSSPPPLLQTLDARGAVHVLVPEDGVPEMVARLSGLPEVGAIRTAAQFLPPDAAAKSAELRRLESLTPFEPAFRDAADEASLTQSFTDLAEQLAAVAESPAASPALKDAALRLRRAVMLFVTAQPLTPARAASLEQSLFGGLAQLSAMTQKLAALEPPAIRDLDPRLLSRFVSPQGIWRVEVMPRAGLSELSFAASIRRAVPEAAGAPMVALVRNEIIHHETLLALASALLAAAVILLIALRNLRAWLLSLAPAGAFITLSAAITVTFNISLGAAMLAGVGATIAVLVCSAMQIASQLTSENPQAGFATALRSALLPPLALAGAVGPLAVSSRPSVAELGAGLAVLLMLAAVLGTLLLPTLNRWLDALMGRQSREPDWL